MEYILIAKEVVLNRNCFKKKKQPRPSVFVSCISTKNACLPSDYMNV